MRSVHASVVALVVAIAFACDRSPTAVPPPALQASRSNPSPAPSSSGKHSGLVVCSQTYASVTQVIGPKGGAFAVGPHYLFVDSLALSDTVRITAVAPADTVRWVRFQPDGLVFQPTVRSEEHTSELQSQSNLVCRLLLEKKKKKKYIYLSE